MTTRRPATAARASARGVLAVDATSPAGGAETDGCGDARDASRPRTQRQADRSVLHGRAGAPGHGPGRRPRGPQPDRALRQPPGRRRQPDPRQHLRRPGAERAARHGGGVRRHRHAEERRALPRRRAVRRRGHRREGQEPADRRHPAQQAADHLPGHEEPDRPQGRPPHPGGVAARTLRGAHPELDHLRHLQAPPRRRAQAPARHPRPGQAGRARPDRAHRGGGGDRGRARRRHDDPARPVGGDRRQGGQGAAPGPALPRARTGRAGDPRGVQRRLPRRGDRRRAAVQRRAQVRGRVQPRSRRSHRVLRSPPPTGSRCSRSTTCTSRCTRRSTARCGCRRAAR